MQEIINKWDVLFSSYIISLVKLLFQTILWIRISLLGRYSVSFVINIILDAIN